MSIDWGNFVITIVAVVIGAWGAYHFNIRQENKRQKDIERAQLTQLFYDLHILSKKIYEHYLNVLEVIDNVIKNKKYYLLNSLMDLKSINIDQFGFITLKSNKMYEILTLIKNENLNFMEQCINYNNSLINEKNMNKLGYLNNIEILSPKLLTMIYVNLFNINSMLMKYYESNNLIEDIALKNVKQLSKFINKTRKEYEQITNNSKLIDKYTNKYYAEKEKKGYKEDLDYINYVLNEWMLDFNLSKKEKKIIEKI